MEGTRIRVPEHNLVFEPALYRGREFHEEVVQLDVRIWSPKFGRRVLIESVAGVDADNGARIANAIEKFCLGDLHAILSVCAGDKYGADQVEWEEWTNGRRHWRVCLGPLLCLHEDAPEVDYAGFLDDLRELALLDLTQETHWIRIFYMSDGTRRASAEALLDNDPWPAAQAILEAKAWPNIGSVYAYRHFLVLTAKAT